VSRRLQDVAAIDEVCGFFEETIQGLKPHSEPGKPFHLLGDEAGMLRDQPKNSGFHRLFDVRFGWDAASGDSYLPLERGASVLILIGYLGSIKNRRTEKIMRQDEELIARYLLRENAPSPTNRPFNWDITPPAEMEELDESGSATIVILRYEVHYVCDPV
jgi:hypothetical protein